MDAFDAFARRDLEERAGMDPRTAERVVRDTYRVEESTMRKDYASIWQAVDAEPEGAGMHFEGAIVLHPFVAHDGPERVDPALHYGFEVEHTGGGCTALRTVDDMGREILLTDPETLDHRDLRHDGAWAMVGLQDGEAVWQVEYHDDGSVTVTVHADPVPESRRTLEIDGEDYCSLADFLEANDGLSPYEIAALRGLEVGESTTIGGGAFAEATIRRTR